MAATRNPGEERFRSFCGDEDPATRCIPWLGAGSQRGHGVFAVGGSSLPAHRFAYLMVHDVIPADISFTTRA